MDTLTNDEISRAVRATFRDIESLVRKVRKAVEDEELTLRRNIGYTSEVGMSRTRKLPRRWPYSGWVGFDTVVRAG